MVKTLVLLDEEAERPLFEACKSSCMENSMVHAKAAHIIWHDTFEDDLSWDKQNISITFIMQQLVDLIIEGFMSKSVAE